MKDILMLLEDTSRTSTAEFYNPKITKVELTIEGIPNQLSVKVCRHINSGIKSIFALKSKRDKKQKKLQKT